MNMNNVLAAYSKPFAMRKRMMCMKKAYAYVGFPTNELYSIVFQYSFTNGVPFSGN